MFKTGQHVEITSPRLLEILARRKSKPFGTVVAVDPQAEYPVKVRITDDMVVYHKGLEWNVRKTDDGYYTMGNSETVFEVVV